MTAPPAPPAATARPDEEPEDAEGAVTYWRGRWADGANALADAVGVIHDLARHATPIAHDADGFVSVGYTVTVGAVHRAYAWLHGASPGAAPQTWEQYEASLAAQRKGTPEADAQPSPATPAGALAATVAALLDAAKRKDHAARTVIGVNRGQLEGEAIGLDAAADLVRERLAPQWDALAAQLAELGERVNDLAQQRSRLCAELAEANDRGARLAAELEDLKGINEDLRAALGGAPDAG